MPDIRPVTKDFAVAPQIRVEDIQAIADAGYKTLINNRPDGEVPGQMTIAQAASAAQAAGMAFVSIPFAGGPRTEQVEAMIGALEANAGPILAVCRSGTRSITVWALAQAASGAMKADEIIGAAAEAGYDLSPYRRTFDQLAAG
jgi:sulfide:quinone oxidoreductase